MAEPNIANLRARVPACAQGPDAVHVVLCRERQPRGDARVQTGPRGWAVCQCAQRLANPPCPPSIASVRQLESPVEQRLLLLLRHGPPGEGEGTGVHSRSGGLLWNGFVSPFSASFLHIFSYGPGMGTQVPQSIIIKA